MWPNPQDTVDLVTFTEDISNGKLYLLFDNENMEKNKALRKHKSTLSFNNFHYIWRVKYVT